MFSLMRACLVCGREVESLWLCPEHQAEALPWFKERPEFNIASHWDVELYKTSYRSAYLQFRSLTEEPALPEIPESVHCHVAIGIWYVTYRCEIKRDDLPKTYQEAIPPLPEELDVQVNFTLQREVLSQRDLKLRATGFIYKGPGEWRDHQLCVPDFQGALPKNLYDSARRVLEDLPEYLRPAGPIETEVG